MYTKKAVSLQKKQKVSRYCLLFHGSFAEASFLFFFVSGERLTNGLWPHNKTNFTPRKRVQKEPWEKQRPEAGVQELGETEWSSEVRLGPGPGHAEPAPQFNEVKHLCSLWMFLLQQFKQIVAVQHGKPPKMDGFNVNVSSYISFLCFCAHTGFWHFFFFTTKSSLIF